MHIGFHFSLHFTRYINRFAIEYSRSIDAKGRDLLDPPILYSDTTFPSVTFIFKAFYKQARIIVLFNDVMLIIYTIIRR